VTISAPARINVVAVLVALTTALFFRAWLQLSLQTYNFERHLATDLSYLVLPPILFLLLVAVILQDRGFLSALLKFNKTSLRLLLVAILIGLLFRVSWWSQLTARISFGLISNTDPNAIEGPVFQYICPPLPIVILGVTVWAILVPFIEEVIHRGYVQTLFHRNGPLVSIVISSVVFTVFHRSSGWQFAFAGGLILGTLYWVSGSLWPSIVTHSVINLTPQFTWRCMSLQWNPSPESLPLLNPGVPAVLTFLVSTGILLWLVLAKCRRQDN